MAALPQHMQALANANEIRLGVAAAKQRVKALPPRAGAELVADIVENDYADPVIGTVRMYPLLVSVKKIGDEKARTCLKAAGVMYYEKRLRDLTKRQRDAVALQLRLWAVGNGR